MNRHTHSTGWGLIRLPHARNLDKLIDEELKKIPDDAEGAPGRESGAPPSVAKTPSDLDEPQPRIGRRQLASDVAMMAYRSVALKDWEFSGRWPDLEEAGVVFARSPEVLDAAELLVRTINRELHRLISEHLERAPREMSNNAPGAQVPDQTDRPARAVQPALQSSKSAGVLGSAERVLTVELAALALARVAPDELGVLDATSEEYFDDPAALLRPDEGEGGSGIGVTMLTPLLLAASSAALRVLGTMAGELRKDVAKDLVKDPVVSWIRQLFRQDPADPSGSEALTAEQAARVRGVVLAQCHALGLPSGEAALIADATVGSLHVRS